jgi:hypothetical protein
LKVFRDDLLALGLRADHDQYETRGTFKSLAEDDGASPEKIRWVMWGRRGTVEDGYSKPAWAAFCQEVAKLNISILQGSVIQLQVANAKIGTMKGTNASYDGEIPMIPRAGGEVRTPDLLITKEFRRHNPAPPGSAKPAPHLGDPGLEVKGLDLGNGALVPLCQFGPATVTLALRDTLARWEASGDRVTLASDLRRLLEEVGHG